MASLLSQLNSELSSLLDSCIPRTCTIFPLQMNVRTGSHGSGWVYSREIIVTNHHVVEGSAGEAVIRTANEGEIRAKVLGSDEKTDLAVLRASGLTATPFVLREQGPRMGEICLAIGTPMDKSLQNSVSLGVIGGVGRQVALKEVRFEEAIQTDATINPGNSGGPLVDIDGQVIGVNFLGTNAKSGFSGVGFAIPGEIVREIVPELVEYGHIARATIGASITSRHLKTPGGFTYAVAVSKADTGSSLKVGDIVVAVNGRQIGRRYDLIKALNRKVIGTTLKIEVIREGKSESLDVLATERAST
jgi:serine protease Do